MSKRLKKIGKYVLQFCLIAFLVLCIVEIAYRYQWFDSYKSEWKYHNDGKQSSADKTSVLVLGDSFTANKTSWLSKWNELDSSLLCWNGSVPGIGVETHRLTLFKRLRQSHPKHVIIQLYVGNDLIDIRKPINWSKYGIMRNLFWSWSNRFRVLNFMNYRMGQVSQDVVGDNDPKEEDQFSVARYSERTKLYIKGDASYPQNMIRLSGGKNETFNKQLKWLKEMKQDLPAGTKMTVLIIPHCAQVDERYISRYQEMGAKIDRDVLKKSRWKKQLVDHGFSVVSPLEFFQRCEKKGEQLYFNNDPHLTETGQTRLAEFMGEKLHL